MQYKSSIFNLLVNRSPPCTRKQAFHTGTQKVQQSLLTLSIASDVQSLDASQLRLRIPTSDHVSVSVLVLVETELIFFLVAGAVLCFGFGMKIMLITD